MIGMHVSERQLNDHADGLLPLPEKEQVDSHLAACETCAGELRQLKSLLAGLGSLPKAIPPGEDLRPGVHARIGRAQSTVGGKAVARRGRVWTARSQLAAAAVVLVMLSSAATWYLARGSNRSHLPAVVARSAPSPAANATFARFQVLEAEYLRAADELRSALERQEELLDPATAELLERNLRIIDQALQESRAALLADPHSEVLQQMILTTYERKLEILRRAEALSVTS